MANRGLFVGLVTLDLIYLADAPPQPNQKIVAQETTIAAGGPATNAAIAFQHLGNSSTLFSAIGCHPICHLIKADLKSINVMDLDPDRQEPPSISSIVVSQSTGDRAVISLNAVRTQLSPDCIPSSILDEVDIILIDGHQMAVGAEIAKMAGTIPVVIDAGSWKPGFEQIFPYVDYAICSANFQAPTEQSVFDYLYSYGIENIAITQGEHAIEVFNHPQIKVPQVNVKDTLGAGDIFHGAFCHFILQHDFVTALAEAARVASYSCEFFGTRQWMRSAHSYNIEAR
ncbi:PfkB family carbohydrate kinase [Leptolyngbya boryana CZ1]|uniref:PfkB family carbohydrate kinase n=1 Tax=Leptolyngbya boryana CZ1 TaxID=3060204 RepID=A0AA97AY43_LEPBY|nr:MULTISPECIES: PfkB family carbohydrate kinase [Leptolyngbya]MBD1856335.1 sugar kinase [Leptolyngbya sp. FACHB-1624]WNZ47996.1 PfkB family carbohydrate kinase [Leptolyngbya boryana CZ1]